MNTAEKYADGISIKRNSKEHGIGLMNVKDVVCSYNGAVNIESQNGIFMVVILVPLNEAVYDIKQTV